MSKEMILFDKDELSYKDRFYRLMDLLVSNKSTSRMESLILFGIFYLQLLVGFFDPNIGVLQKEYSHSDSILDQVYNILRVKGLIKDNFSAFQIAIYLIIAVLLGEGIHFILLVKKQKKIGFFTYNEFLLNFTIKVFIYVIFNPVLDLCLSTVCFDTYNPNFSQETCSITDHATVFLLAFILFVYAIFLAFSINLYYNDSYFLSNSYYSRMNCGYEVYMTLNCIIYSVLLTQAKYLGKEIFLIYNFIISLILLKFYFGKFLFYNQGTNLLVGLFHILYAWTSLFFLVFAFVNMDEKGIVYVIGSVIIVLLFFNLYFRLQEYIILKTPFHKITNKYHIMFYLKNLIDKIHNIEGNVEAKAILVGIIQHHSTECPSPGCITKHKNKKLFLPVTEEWSNRDKPEINDKVFLLNLVIVMMNYFIGQSYYNSEMLINLSLYYLQVIGNHCMAIFYYTKVKDMKLSVEDNFAFMRLNFAISKTLVEKLKPANEPNQNLEDINISYYYKYEELSQKFFDEISNDINLSLEFWKSFKTHHETGRPLDFTKIFHLTDKIRLTKNRIDKLWSDLYNTYSGVNDIFELYENYVEQINDDDLLKRDLEAIKSKNISSSDHITTNIYQLLFAKETGIIICNGDRGKEGIIEKINEDAEKIFDYKADEVKGVNLTQLMPKMFEKIHKGFLERFFDIGEKKRVDKSFKSFAKDRDNCLLPVRLYVKVFPLLNESIFYCGMATKEQLDDVILIDNKFNIQAITRKLVQKFELDNKNVFQENDIPFYIICRKFIHFYKIFLKGAKSKKKNNKNKSYVNSSITGSDNVFTTTNFSGTNLHTNLKSSNNLGTSADHDFSDTKGQSNTNMDSDETGSGLGRQSNPGMMSGNKLIEEVMGDGGPAEDSADIEINENIELEYEIQIPMFLRDYMDSMNKKDKNKKLIKGGTSRSEQDSKEDNDETKEDFDENDGLVNNDETRGAETEGKEGKNFNKQSDEDKEFQMKIRQCRNLFELGKFDELEDFIQRMNNERAAKEYKFNFTFEKYSFGNRGMSYFIRCIDNKAEYEDSQSQNMTIDGNGDEKAKAYRQQKAKIESLKEANEITTDEKHDMNERLVDYVKLCMDGGDFTKNLSTFRDEIAMTSKIFGMKKEETTLDDENSSQSSQSGFNDNIAKKSRIEEIRSNIMNNVSNFYTLKWIKGIFYFIILLTAAFCGFYLMIFDIINNDLSNISNLNIGLYQTTIWTCNIISTLLSLRSTYQFNIRNYPIKYYSYIPEQFEYYKTLSNFTKTWYKDVIVNFGPLEKQINLYFDNSMSPDLFWTQGSITYPSSKVVLADTESLTMTLSQVLSDTNQLLQNPFFTNDPSARNATGFTPHMKELINYSSFMSIENALDNLLPRLFKILNAAPEIFLNENNGNMRYVIIIVLGYTFTILLMIFIYAILLYLTNKNMEEGLEKVSKIKLERIDETIKKIESFNDKSLSKFRQKETKTIIVEEAKEVKSEVQTPSNSSSQMKEAYQKNILRRSKVQKT
jgi:PAS domain S-box-containing protein